MRANETVGGTVASAALGCGAGAGFVGGSDLALICGAVGSGTGVRGVLDVSPVTLFPFVVWVNAIAFYNAECVNTISLIENVMSRSTQTPASLIPKGHPRRSFASLRAIFALMLREMSTSYGRSPGGYAWAIAEPVAAIGFLSLVFSAIFQTPPVGNSFPMFYATGMLPFMLFNDIHNKVAGALLYSKPLLAYPKVTFLDAILARFFLNMLTQSLVAYLVFTLTIILFEGRMHIEPAIIVRGFVLSGLLGLGIGTLNAFIYLRIPVWQLTWSVLTRPLFILSCAMMMYEGVPQPYRDWLWWNPLVHVIGLVRTGFYDSYDGYYVVELFPLLVAMICFALGLLFLRRNYRDLFEKT